MGFSIEETAGGVFTGVAYRFKEEVAGFVVAVAFDFDRDDTEFSFLDDAPEEVYVEFLVGVVVFDVVDGDSLI